jgi:hypothetical protein
MDTEQAETLAKLRHGMTVAIALLVDSMSWLHLPDDLRAQEQKAFDGIAGLLRQNGWRVVPVRAGDELTPLWPQAARGGQELDLPLDRIRRLTAAMRGATGRSRGNGPAAGTSGASRLPTAGDGSGAPKVGSGQAETAASNGGSR